MYVNVSSEHWEIIPAGHSEKEADKDGCLEDDKEEAILDGTSISVPTFQHGATVKLKRVEKERQNLQEWNEKKTLLIVIIDMFDNNQKRINQFNET